MNLKIFSISSLCLLLTFCAKEPTDQSLKFSFSGDAEGFTKITEKTIYGEEDAAEKLNIDIMKIASEQEPYYRKTGLAF